MLEVVNREMIQYHVHISFYTTQSLMNSSKEEMRELAALFYSVVVSTVSGNELKSMIEQLIKTTKDNHVCYQFCLYLLCTCVCEIKVLQKHLIYFFYVLISKMNA